MRRIQTCSNLTLFLEKVAPSIRRAMEGEADSYRCHPDYIIPLEPSAYVGSFPENITTAYWIHGGFQDSWKPNAYLSNVIEIHGILELKHGHYLVFQYVGGEIPQFNATVTLEYEKAVGALDPLLQKKYEQETEPVEWGGEDRTACNLSFGLLSPIQTRGSPVPFVEPPPHLPPRIPRVATQRSHILNPEDMDWSDEEETNTTLPRIVSSYPPTGPIHRPIPLTPPPSRHAASPPPAPRKIRPSSFA